MVGSLIEHSSGPLDDALSDAEAWGIAIPPDMMGDTAREGVWPENVPAMEAYCAVATQWRVIALADGRKEAIGLDYPAVKVGLEMAGITVTPALWSDLQMIEIGARAAMNGEAT